MDEEPGDIDWLVIVGWLMILSSVAFVVWLIFQISRVIIRFL